MRANISQTVVRLVDGIDCTHIGRQVDLLKFLLTFVEFVNAVYGAYPKFIFTLAGNEGDRVFGRIVFYLIGRRMYAFEVVISSCPYIPFFIPIDASDVFVGTDIGVSGLLWRKGVRNHLFLST